MKIKASFIALALSFATPAVAQKQVYACQYVASGGLSWESSKWVTTQFQLRKPFFLKAENNSLDVDSLKDLLKVTQRESVVCLDTKLMFQSCATHFGGIVSFSFFTLNGSVATTFGDAYTPATGVPDSLMVSAFTCTKVE